MSVSYRIAGRGARLTLPRLKRLAQAHGGRVTMPPSPDERSRTSRLLSLPSGYLHVYQTGRTAWNAFIRYGGNWEAEQEWVGILENEGFLVISEHDE